CDSRHISSLPTGTRASDFICPSCDSQFQLKSKSSQLGNRIVDGAYSAMREAIKCDRTPNLYLLHYKLPELAVQNVLLIPHFAYSLSLLEKRKPLSPSARRAGWVGCNFLLDRIPRDAKIPVVDSGKAVSPAIVRKAYERVRPLEKLNIEKRGWTLDVLNVIRSLKKNEFELSEVYGHADQLAELHPQNHHIHDKIRQQLQVLRDLNFLEFLGSGSYRLH
ncbi:MAG: restriction endonuclease, partial [Acidobacteria bacterium]|nr:restriction endonuclease [Acidobacteriota bacterium]